MSERDAPIGTADIQERIGTLTEYLKDADRDVAEKRSDLWRAEQNRDRIKAEMGAWQKALTALKEAGIHL